MSVGEFFPGGGYYTRMLSDVVGPRGHVYGLENAGWTGAVDADNKVLAEGKWKNVSMDAKPLVRGPGRPSGHRDLALGTGGISRWGTARPETGG